MSSKSKNVMKIKNKATKKLTPLKDRPTVDLDAMTKESSSPLMSPIGSVLPLAVFPKPTQSSGGNMLSRLPGMSPSNSTFNDDMALGSIPLSGRIENNTSNDDALSDDMIELDSEHLIQSNVISITEESQLNTHRTNTSNSETGSITNRLGLTKDIAIQTIAESSGTLKDAEILNYKSAVKMTEEKLIESYTERDNLLKRISELSYELIEANKEKSNYIEENVSLRNEIKDLKQCHGNEIAKEQGRIITIGKELKRVMGELQFIRSNFDRIKDRLQSFDLNDYVDKRAMAMKIVSYFPPPPEEEAPPPIVSPRGMDYDDVIVTLEDNIRELELKLSQQRSHYDESMQQMTKDISSLHSAFKLEKELHHVTKEKMSQLKQELHEKENRSTEHSLLFDNLMNEKMSLTATHKKIYDMMHILQEKKQNEGKALKHTSHVKDLHRIASIRELSIEKDKLLSNIDRLQDVMNVYTFDIKTMEQSPYIVNPVTVDFITKLQENRQNRLKMIEKDYKVRSKDIDQRSADTCTVNTKHLEGFQAKAALKLKEAEDDYSQLLQQLLQLFSAATSSQP